MNKRLIIFGVLLAALLLSAASPWPAVLDVWNYTGDNIYITLKYRGEQKYFLTATPKGNSDTYNVSRFELVRRVYSAKITACATTTSWGRLRMASNLRLVFPDCLQMQRVSSVFLNSDWFKWKAGDAAARTQLCTKYGIPAATCPTASATPPAAIPRKVSNIEVTGGVVTKIMAAAGWWGEPTMEKVTFFVAPSGAEFSPPDGPWWGGYSFKNKAGTKQAFRFLYDLP